MTNEELRRAIRETQDQYRVANYREHLLNHLKELMAIEIERAKLASQPTLQPLREVEGNKCIERQYVKGCL